MKKNVSLVLAVFMVLTAIIGCGQAPAPSGGQQPTEASAAATTATTAAAEKEETTAKAEEKKEETTAATTTAKKEEAPAATTVKAEEPVQVLDAKPMRYYMPGSSKLMGNEINFYVNEQLAKDGVPVIFESFYIPWDQWVNKINVMLASGDEFELLHIMEDYIPTSIYAGRDGLYALDDLIQQWAPELIDLFDPVLWSCATVNGKIYSIPAFWRDNSGDGEGKLAVRKDKFDEFGLPIPGSQEEALEVLPVLNEMWKAQDGVDRYVFEHSPGRCPVAFHRTYDSWPFYASQDGIFKVTQNAEASLYFESEEFKKDADFMNALFNLGLIHPDAMNLPNDVKSDIIAQRGDYLLCIMTPGANPITLERNGIMGAVNYSFVFEPEKPYLCNLPLLNSNGIPSTTKNPESALLFLNWLYSDPENQYLLLHGVEGLTWNRVGTDKYERIRNDQNQVLYAFDAWMIEYCTANHLWDVDDISTDLEKQDFMTNIYPDNTVYSPMVGFNFNSEPVSMELANMMSEYTASILPIKLGLLSYDGNFESAISKMKAAGCDRVIAEYQQQLNDYLASKN